MRNPLSSEGAAPQAMVATECVNSTLRSRRQLRLATVFESVYNLIVDMRKTFFS
jgi:hypothetical protein